MNIMKQRRLCKHTQRAAAHPGGAVGFFSLPDSIAGLVLGHCSMLAYAENLTVFTEFFLMDISSSRELQLGQAVLRMHSVVARNKALSTCTPQPYK
ncbi:uncharacterized protein [Manis javanica]|uniref:uncharacterized protein isoform X7 n=1 Tax=Manis javanica TaxID=9974 RepID=UPI003C6CD64C